MTLNLNKTIITTYSTTVATPTDYDTSTTPKMEVKNRPTQIAEVLITNYKISSALINDTTTPQHRALDWIANWDTYNLPPTDGPALIQRYVLAVLYYSTDGAHWKDQKKWLSPVHECEWSDNGGVRKCDRNNEGGFGAVQDLSLWNNLRGTIPTELGLLSELRTLYLSRNELVGTIPTELGKLTRLEYLGLQHNKLTGTVPAFEFANLKRLKSFYMEKNDLTGVVRHVEPLCGLFKEGNLKYLTADCRVLVAWKQPEILCACCTTCHLP